MFHFGGFPSLYYLIHIMIHDSSSWWFPNSEISGSLLIYSSPKLIAVSHVLRRLPMPRHSPYALVCLNFFKMILLKWIYHFALSIANNFSVVYFTVNFAFCAKCSFYQLYGKTYVLFFIFFSWKITFSLSQLSVSFSFFIRFSMNIFLA